MRELDRLDEAIMELVQQDPRASYTKLAEALGVSQGTVRNRFQYLVDNNVLRIVAFKNPNLSGSNIRAFVGIGVNPGRLNEVTEALTAIPYVRYLAVATGSYHLVALVEFETRQQMLSFLADTVPTIEGVEALDSFVILGVLKRLGGPTSSMRELLDGL